VSKLHTEDHTLVVTHSDIQRWSESLKQGNLDQLAAALYIKLLSQSQPKHFFGVTSFGLAKGRGVIVCSNSQTKRWIQANAFTVLSGGYKAWNEREDPEVKRRRLRVFIVTQGELPPVPALLASLREQNAGLTTLGWYLFRSHHIPGRRFHTLWCVPENQPLRLVNPGLFWGFYHLDFKDLHPNKNLDQAEQDENTVTLPLVSGEVATHSIATRRLVAFKRSLDADTNIAYECDIINHRVVQQAIYSFGSFKSPGPDGIFPEVLKKAWEVCSNELLGIFSACLKLGYVPLQWRETKVVFISKQRKKIMVSPPHGDRYLLLRFCSKLWRG